jgi:hypothetical protein
MRCARAHAVARDSYRLCGGGASAKAEVPSGVVRRAAIERREGERRMIEGIALRLEACVETAGAVGETLVALHAVPGARAWGDAQRHEGDRRRIAREQQRFHGRAGQGTIEDNRKLARAIPRARAKRRRRDDGPPQR